ncbi:MAG: IPT/TIG domain-containing protein, partial [Alistipes sp.]|nr:IPT/TIG domain-containing protein [Alistipes sp.]
MKRFQYHMVALAAALLTAGCADTYVEEYVPEAPVIESFAPTSALSGEDTPIVVTGRHLHAVTSARIGGREVRILERVSNTQLSIVATRDARTGSIELTNSVGTTASEATLTIDYPGPVIRAEELPSEVDMFGELTLKGRYMAVVRKVIVTDGTGQGREAEIRSQDAAEVVIRVPYVETPTARITLRYDEADTEAETPLDSAPQIGIVRLVPTLDALDFDRLIVGRITTLRGTNLDQITAVKVGGVEANIASQSAAELRFTVPAVEGFEEGDANATTLTIDYFDGFESQAVCETIPATVLAFKIWEGITTCCQDAACRPLSSFFSPETGLVYHNSLWPTEVDPLSYGSGGKVCSAENMPSVSEAEYNSVNPYFYFSANSYSGSGKGSLQINSPARNNTLKNFYLKENGKGSDRIFGGAPASGGGFGTPALTFRYLDPAAHNEKELADRVRNLDFLSIDETTFPIDPVQKTVAGVNLQKPTASTNSLMWAPGIFPETAVEQRDVPVDAVLLVLY